MRIAAALFLSTACSVIEDEEPVRPVNPQVFLSQQTARIRANLHFCDNRVVSGKPNNISGRPRCDTGDTWVFSGLYNTIAHDPEISASLDAAVLPSGQPCRGTEYLVLGDKCDFSRDQTKGFLLNLLETKNKEVATKTWQFVYNNDYSICDLDVSENCFQTPGMLILWGDVFEKIGLPREPDMQYGFPYTEQVDRQELLAEARVNNGYRLHLVSVSIYIKALTGQLTSAYSEAARILAERKPDNLWFQFLSNYTNGGDQDTYDRIARKLVPIMERWNPGNDLDWIWQRDGIAQKEPEAYGHELVFLAELLQGE